VIAGFGDSSDDRIPPPERWSLDPATAGLSATTASPESGPPHLGPRRKTRGRAFLGETKG
jgi:hypothetical protein